MSTIENQVYGVPHWKKCVCCGVTQPPASLRFQPAIDPLGGYVCLDEKKCAEWHASLSIATPADVAAAASTPAKKDRK